MLTDRDWSSIYGVIEKSVAQRGEYLLTSKVIKRDELNGIIWVAELGDQPIPVFDFDYAVKYYDSNPQVGEIITLTGTTIPSNSMLAVGTSLLRSSYPELFNEIGTRYGAVDGSHFSLPNLVESFIYGAAENLSNLGTEGGEATHTLTAAESGQKAVSTGNDTPDHAHGIAHDHPIQTGASVGAGSVVARGTGTVVDLGGGGAGGPVKFPSPAVNSAGATARHTHPISGSDATNAHNNLPPYVRLAFAIVVEGSAVVEKTAKITIALPEVGDIVLVGMERGTRRLPRCLGKLQSKNFIMSSLDDA